MTSYTASNFISVLNASATATQMEPVINGAISTLNIFNCGIPLLAGTAGSQTADLTSAQYGAVLYVARVAYASYFKNADNKLSVGMSPISMATADLMSNPSVLAMIKDVAMQLITATTQTTGPQIVVGRDTS
jgi:hypothetical protein